MNNDTMDFAPRPSSKFWFAMVDNAVIMDSTLSSTAVRIFCIICSFANRETRSWSLKIKTIANAAGCNERTVQNALKALIDRGVIEKREQFRGGQQVASAFVIVGGEAPCYHADNAEPCAEAAPCENSHPRPAEICTPTPQKISPPPRKNLHPVLQESLLQEPVLREDAPLPPAEAGEASSSAEGSADSEQPVSLSRFVQLWNAELCPLGFPKVSKVTPARERAFRARVNDLSARRSLSWWRQLVSRLADSDFMRTAARDKAKWLDLDWFLNESNLVKVTEGKYDNERSGVPLRDRRGQAVEKFSAPESRDFSQEQEDYLDAKHGGRQLDPDYMAYLEDKYGGGKLWH